MGAAGGIAIAGANMWALLLDKDPGHSAAASDLAVDVVDQKIKKAAAVTAVVQAEKAPPARNVAKPAKRGDKAKKNKKSAGGDSKQPANVSKVQTNGGVARDSKQTATPPTVPDSDELADGLDEIKEMLAALARREKAEEAAAKEKMFAVVTARGGRRRTVARTGNAEPVEEGIAATGATNMWALLLDKDPGHSAAAGGLAADVLDRKLKKAAAVVQNAKPSTRGQKAKEKKGVSRDENQAAGPDAKGEVQIMNGADKQTEPPATTMDGSSKVRIDGAAGGDKQTVVTATVPDSDELADEIKDMLASLARREEAEEAAAKEEMFAVVTARGGRRRTVTSKSAALVAEGTTVVTGTNMWALLSNDGVSHDGAKPAKRGKKTKTKKKGAAGDNKKAVTDSRDDEVTPPTELEEASTVDDEVTPPSELEEEMIEEEEETTEEAATGGSRCRRVVSRVCRAALAVGMLALYFQFTSTSPSHA